MRRGRGKGRKFGAVVTHEDAASGGEESLPSYKRRGRPSKPMKEEPDEDELEKNEEENDSEVKLDNFNKEMNGSSTVEDKEKKRKRNPKQQNASTKEENSTQDSTKANGFRQNGSRRKSKPRRAAEVGVECR